VLEIGSVLGGKYKILSEIGHGGMSVVYMALNEVANKTWAVKEIRKDGKMDFNVVRQGLVAEIETLKKLKHPNLPSIVDVIEDEDSFIIVMDYIEGNSLDKSLLEHGAQPQDLVVEWAMQLCDVLAYLHSCNPPIIYRDMKPANIMLKPDGNIALIDFGTAKTYEIDLGETTGIGTIGYAAPEQYIGSGLGRTDARTDIYCLGITLYHLLTGIDPCKVVIADKSIREVNPSLSPGLDKIIVKCTEPDPKNRYQSCEELLYDLEHHHELGDAYKRKQKTKLISFVSTVVAAFVFALVSVWGFLSAENIKSGEYTSFINVANAAIENDEENKWQIAGDNYISAIKSAPEKEEGYNGIIEMVQKTGSDLDENISKSELSLLNRMLNEPLEDDMFGGQSELTVMDALKTENPELHKNICRKIGVIIWYYHNDSGGRHGNAKKWFERIQKEDTFAKTMCEIENMIPQIEAQQVGVDVKNYLEKISSLYNSISEVDEIKNDKALQKLILEEIVVNMSSINFLDRIPEGKEQEALDLLKKVENSLINGTLITDEEERQEAQAQIIYAVDRINALKSIKKGGEQQ